MEPSAKHTDLASVSRLPSDLVTQDNAGGVDERTPVPRSSWALGLLAALALAQALKVSAPISLPIATAFLIALSVWPLCRVVRDRMPKKLRWVGVTTAMLIVLVLIAAFIAGLALAASQVAAGIDQFGGEARARLQETFTSGRLGSLVTAAQQFVGGATSALQQVQGFARGLLAALWSTIAGMGLIVVLVLLMLTEGDAWSAKLAAIARDNRWHEAATAIGQRFRDYFLATLAIGGATGLLYAGFLSVVGLRFAFVFALLGGLGNFIPSLGSIFTVALPTAFALALNDPSTALFVFGGLLVIEIVMGNVIQPLFTGDRLAISPLVVIVSLLVWSWIWGTAGALLAVPMTALMLIVLAQVPRLRPLALMLSDKRAIAAVRAAAKPR